jgi:hypothetical protein
MVYEGADGYQPCGVHGFFPNEEGRLGLAAFLVIVTSVW